MVSSPKGVKPVAPNCERLIGQHVCDSDHKAYEVSISFIYILPFTGRLMVYRCPSVHPSLISRLLSHNNSKILSAVFLKLWGIIIYLLV